MFRKTISGITLTSLLTSVLTLTFIIQTAGASDTIYIRADGRIDPPTALISTFENVTYTFTGNIDDSIVVERDSIVIDGAGYTLQGSGGGIGIDLSGRNNVIIENTTIKELYYGIYFDQSSNSNSIAGNSITSNIFGIWFDSSSNGSIYHNDFVDNARQVYSSLSVNVWDDGYPSGGNYWSDYAGTDLHNGVDQNEAGSDWIGDSPYTIDQNNTDRYPLMHPFSLEMQKYEVAYRDLLHRYKQMHSELVALNSTCRSLQELIYDLTMTCDLTRDNLQGQINSLNGTCVSLSQSLTELQEHLNGLNSTIQALSNQVNNLLNLVYVLAGVSVVLIIVTIYFASRKPKPITRTEMETSKEPG